LRGHVSCIVCRAMQKNARGGKLRTRIIAALACVPFAAHAEKLLVEYHGTVSSVERAYFADAPLYAVGDSIGGSLIIDATLAPADELSNDPRIGRYSSAVDFILGPRPPGAPGNGDLLVVYDNWASPAVDMGPHDGVVIRDQSIGTEGTFDLVLGMRRPNQLGQLFSADGFAQSFTAESEPGIDLWGYVESGFGEFWRAVRFTLDRFSVSPGTCRAT
jgi:hypothetical protein